MSLNVRETFKQHLKHYLEELKLIRDYSPHTARAYQTDINEFIDWISEQNQATLNVPPEQIRRFFRHRVLHNLCEERRLSARSQARKIAALRMFFKYCQRNQIIRIDPMAQITTPKFAKKLPKTATSEDLTNVFALFTNDKTLDTKIKNALKVRNHAICEVLYSTGLRVSELLSIRLIDVMPKIPEQLKITGKGKKERFVFLHILAQQALSTYLQVRPLLHTNSPALFVNAHGKELTARGTAHILSQISKKLGLQHHLHPHKFRHSFATDLMNNGVDIRFIQEFLGHSSLKTTQVYTHVSKAHLQRVYRDCHPHA